MATVVSLESFIGTGYFGPVTLGDPIETVKQALGTPSYTFNPEVVVPPLSGFTYNGYEFVFKHDRLVYFQNDNFDTDHPSLMEFANATFEVDTGYFRADRLITRSMAESWLRQEQIAYSEIEYWGRKGRRASSGVILDFEDDVPVS
ncbi:MAG: hypothetical protein ACFB10_19605 [Salibacteraceae bacterium]